jgi:peptidoglycan/xylan/chitin deacetylase (PgdA/CDA1 family)
LTNNRRLENFEILGLVLFGIAIALIVIVRPLTTPEAENKTVSSSSYHGKSPPVDSLGSTQTVESSASNIDTNIGARNSINDKVLMINFDDSYKTQLLYAKPILDKYGFKATFFEVCGWVGKPQERQSWSDVAALQNDGMDIESHTMTHAHLNSVSPNKLNYEVGFSKQCIANHGYNATIFGYPDNLGSDNKTVVNVVSKYYSLARTGSDPLMFLHCNGYTKHLQTDCRTFLPDGTLSYVNRYDIRSQSFDHIHSNIALTTAQLFQQFVQRVNSQLPYNKDGTINAFPIITYHNLTYSNEVYNELPSTIMVPLFAQMMKYLHDNGFRVLTMSQLGYDTTNNLFYIMNVPLPASKTPNASTIGKGSS